MATSDSTEGETATAVAPLLRLYQLLRLLQTPSAAPTYTTTSADVAIVAAEEKEPIAAKDTSKTRKLVGLGVGDSKLMAMVLQVLGCWGIGEVLSISHLIATNAHVVNSFAPGAKLRAWMPLLAVAVGCWSWWRGSE